MALGAAAAVRGRARAAEISAPYSGAFVTSVRRSPNVHAPPVKSRARQALIDRLKALLPPDRAALVDDTGRTERFEDNLVGSLSMVQIAQVRDQLGGGDGHELEPGADGERPDAHAAHSSAALAVNAFGTWLGREAELVIDGVGGLEGPLKLEAKQRIFAGGRAPNLDCVAIGRGKIVGVESKLTETLGRHKHTKWSDAYGRPTCRALLSDGWLEALDATRAGSYKTTYLDIDQLLKHALGLSKQNPDRERHLVYVFWEPEDGDGIDEVSQHRREVEALLERVGDASPRLHALPYHQLLESWDALGVAWLRDHVSNLRARYKVRIGTTPA